jgi:hypothetical protein
MITSEPISTQPKRGTDGARVLKPALLAKSLMVEGERKMIKRCAAACHPHHFSFRQYTMTKTHYLLNVHPNLGHDCTLPA